MAVKYKQYAWQVAQPRIEQLINKFDDDMGLLSDAWLRTQAVIAGFGLYYEANGYEKELATAMAWEYFDIAARGRAEPGITGAVFNLWARMPDEHDQEFRKGLEDALNAAQAATEPSKLRYSKAEARSRVRTLDDGFDEPEAVPQDVAPTRKVEKPVVTAPPEIPQVPEVTKSPFVLIDGGRAAPATVVPEEELF